MDWTLLVRIIDSHVWLCLFAPASLLPLLLIIASSGAGSKQPADHRITVLIHGSEILCS